jgi:hypothetical protein
MGILAGLLLGIVGTSIYWESKLKTPSNAGRMAVLNKLGVARLPQARSALSRVRTSLLKHGSKQRGLSWRIGRRPGGLTF